MPITKRPISAQLLAVARALWSLQALRNICGRWATWHLRKPTSCDAVAPQGNDIRPPSLSTIATGSNQPATLGAISSNESQNLGQASSSLLNVLQAGREVSQSPEAPHPTSTGIATTQLNANLSEPLDPIEANGQPLATITWYNFPVEVDGDFALTPAPNLRESAKRRAVCLDCEMVGVTRNGRRDQAELERILAIDFERSSSTTLRTCYGSGITPQKMREAKRDGRIIYGWRAARR
ncbi:hypothetical protein B0H63DRAFT_520491 [Podospora didyma]|uniref:Exonuclease domain-containing protein n=1 Tax=Podospora didyma TaxID=330526 RepID=A0AAE0U5L7_9PEZI|nr:hypothetical protein B0H63DRAFT_520491 [Podospora didyma]